MAKKKTTRKRRTVTIDTGVKKGEELPSDHPIRRKLAEAAADTGLSMSRSMKQADIAPKDGRRLDKNLAEAIKRAVREAKGLPLRERYRGEFIEKGYHLAFALLEEAITPDKLKSASLRDLLYGLGVLMDRLLVASGRFEEKDFQDFHPIQQMSDEQLDVFIQQTRETLTVVRKSGTTAAQPKPPEPKLKKEESQEVDFEDLPDDKTREILERIASDEENILGSKEDATVED